MGASSLRARVAEAVAKKRKCVLLVPEQETLRAEAQMAEILPDGAPLYFEVTNFSRLANTVFRQTGGISYRYADKVSASLLMWKALEAATPFLSLTDKKPDGARVKEMLSALGELYAAGVGEDMLESAARQLPEGERLRDRVSDLALIFRLYKGELAETYGSHAEDLDRLVQILKENKLFGDTLFFVDSFTSFTAQEYRILGELLRQTEVTVALAAVPRDTLSLAYEETRDTAKRLTSLAKAASAEITAEEGEDASLPPAILHAKRELFRADKRHSAFEGENASLTLWREESPFEAAMRVASDIAARVEAGARYRDFVIFARSVRDYRGILDEALEKQGVPFFMSEERDIFSFAAVKMILTAYTVINRGYRKDDIVALLKCGFGGFTPDDIDIFELYADFWHVGGRMFLKDGDLTMNPSGYKRTLSDTEAQTLSRVNSVRRRLIGMLDILREGTDGEVTAKVHLTALYHFLRETRCEERLSSLADAARARGNKAEAEVLERLFGTVCELLDRAYETVGEMTLSRERFADVLALLFSSIGLGQLPTSQDAVMIGNADMLRAEGTRFAYLFGVNEGEFPAAVRGGGAFEDNERRVLSSLGIPIEVDPIVRASREGFCFLRALTSAGEAVTVVSHRKSASGEELAPSSVFTLLASMFGEPKTSERSEPYRPRAAIESLGELAGTSRGAALRALLAEEGGFSRYLEGTDVPLSDTDCKIPPALAESVFGKDMYLTQTRLNDYVSCPFSYYCKSVLRLGENRDASFGFNDIGSLIHAVLERLFLAFKEDGVTVKSVKREALSAYVDRISREYLDEICPTEMADSPRQRHLFARLCRTALIIAEELHDEFAQSKFSPEFFEFGIGKEGGPDPIVFETEDGGRMLFHGTIDRIDTYRGENGRLYLRVIDYKTGTKLFSLSDVEKGKNLQLLIYLFSLWKSRDQAFLERLGLSADEEPLPAGMLYMSASVKDISLPAPIGAEAVREQAKASLTANGLVLEDEEIVRAMDETLSGRYAPTPLDKKGKFKWNQSFASLEKFESILTSMRETVGGIGTAMRKGAAAAVPVETRSSERSPCETCPYFPVCRKTE